jgi:hypothetical protein
MVKFCGIVEAYSQVPGSGNDDSVHLEYITASCQTNDVTYNDELQTSPQENR